MDHGGGGERRISGGYTSSHEAALRAVQRPAAKPWRGAAGAMAPSAPAPPKVYRVAPRDFRELVQRLTGAGGTAPTVSVAMGPRQVMPPAAAAAQPYTVASTHGQQLGENEMFDYASWLSVPLLSPASMPAGGYVDGHLHGNGALL
uniref:VQ domain-containing protein n=1 Tax=Leersia perrieri TaxID=77586 RepID=A0A0D9VXD0_9ORYZ